MSNTAEVTPYVEDELSSPSATASSSVAAALAGVLSRSDADQQADAAWRERRRAERLTGVRLTVLGTSLTPLVQAATDLGYRPVDVAGAVGSRLPVDRIALVNTQGQRIELRTQTNAVDLTGNAPTAALQAIVRQRTLRAVEQHLRSISGGKVQVGKRSDGSVELRAREMPSQRPDGDASVSVVVQASGDLHVDIDNIRGSRCESVLDGIAKAAGGRSRNKKIKPAYYEEDTSATSTRGQLRT
jgi:hypothetical protein